MLKLIVLIIIMSSASSNAFNTVLTNKGFVKEKKILICASFIMVALQKVVQEATGINRASASMFI